MAIKLTNHTAISFPLEYPQGVPEPTPPGFPSGLAGGQQAWLGFWYGEPQLHRFRLEIKKTGIDRSSVVTGVFAIVDGQRHKMKRIKPADPNGPDITGGSENWVWDSPGHLVTEYRYGFEVETERISAPTTRKVTRCPEQGFFLARVALNGLVSWFVPYAHPTTSRIGELDFWEFGRLAAIYVQNLSSTDAFLDLTLSGENRDLFSVSTVSSVPGPLNRGDIVRFFIGFDFSSIPPDTSRTAYLNLIVAVPEPRKVLLRTRFLLYGESYVYGA